MCKYLFNLIYVLFYFIVFDNVIFYRMLYRERELQSSNIVQKVLILSLSDRRFVYYQFRLRIVREFGLFDSTVEVFQNINFYYFSDFFFLVLLIKIYFLKKYLILSRKRKQSFFLSKRNFVGSFIKFVQCVLFTRLFQGVFREVC